MSSTRVTDAVAEFIGDDPGRAVLVADLGEGRALARAGGPIRPPGASLAKLPLVAVALVAETTGTLDLGERIDPDHLRRSRYPSIHGALTSPLTLRELAALAIVVSDNAAAQVLSDHLDDSTWRAGLELLGLPGIPRPAGFTDAHLDDATQVRTSVDEQALLVTTIATDHRLAPLFGWMGDNLRNGRVSRMIPPPTRFHHKTGTLDGVLHDVGVLVGARRRLLVVALTEHQRDPVATEAAMTRLGAVLADDLSG